MNVSRYKGKSSVSGAKPLNSERSISGYVHPNSYPIIVARGPRRATWQVVILSPMVWLMSLIDWHVFVVTACKVAGAYFLALPIGWDREQVAHSTGVRTFPLV